MAKMQTNVSLLDIWVRENNDLVDKCKQQGAQISCLDQDQSRLKYCSSEFHKLLRKIQAIPAMLEHAQLELTVAYNTCVFSIAKTGFSEAELLLTQSLERALQVIGKDPATSDQSISWSGFLKIIHNTDLCFCALRLLCLQWAIWLSTHRLKNIQELKEELSSLSGRLSAADEEEERKSMATRGTSEIPRVVVQPRKLNELLHICTVIAQGAEWLNEGQHSEALSELRRGLSLPAPRNLLAKTHVLSGLCLVKMDRPHMALQCYMKAMEMDPCCVCALHLSINIYSQLGNVQAEIEGLCLLTSALMVSSAPDSSVSDVYPLHPALLLSSPSLKSLLSVPSSSSILHSLASKCVLHGRVSEGVEHYLDLLAALRSNDQHAGCTEVPPSPRLAELHLEAGAAMLQAGRSADCMALCDEVLSTTLELLPERLMLEEPIDDCESVTGSGSGSPGDMLEVMLWAGCAYLLQGHCQAHLNDWKQAVTQYTRCINLMGKVCIKKKGFQIDSARRQVSKVFTLQRLKGLSFAGRGISFTQRDQVREALRDLQLSTQVSPECVSAGLWLGEVLWRLGRTQEAASCWEKSFAAESSVETFPPYLQEPKSGPSLDLIILRKRVEDLTQT